jgi:putative transposase
MAYDPKEHHRRTIRWFAYDYAQAGAYFVTVCAEDHHCLFGQIEGEEVRLTESGLIVHDAWADLPGHYPHVELDAFVIMPNHVHMIVFLTDTRAGSKPAPTDIGPADSARAAFKPTPTNATPANPVGAGLRPAPTQPAPTKRHGLPEIVRAFKAFSSRRINECRSTPGKPVWQRGYYEHVIRGEQQLHHIRRYIHDNPANWMLDHENPQAKGYGQRDIQEPFTN